MKWHTETRKLKDLKFYAKNPRQLSKEQGEQLKTSVEKFGQCEPIVINPDGLIIGGHQRVRTLKKLGYKDVFVNVPETPLDDKQIEELNIRLNKNVGEWDYDILANAWELSDLVQWGFAPEELQIDIETIEPKEEDESQILEPVKDEDAITKLGDIYELLSNGLCHRLICGDSTIPDVVNSVLKDDVPILMVTDPPYGVGYDASWRDVAGKGRRAKGKVQNDDKVNWSLAWHLFPGSVAYIWYASLFHTEVEKSLLDNDYALISQIIWAKQNFTLSRGDYHWHHETCLYVVKKGHKHNWQGARDQSTLWEIASMSAMGGNKDQDMRTCHSTQKPIECMARPIRNNTAKGEGVYDPFLGSGTTLIAAQQLGRVCYGIELSSAYVDICVTRWVNYMTKNNLPYSIKRNGEVIEWKITKE